MRDIRVGVVKAPEIAPGGARTWIEFFCERFPRIDRGTWERRFHEGKVRCGDAPLSAEAPFVPLLDISYERELEAEWPVRRDWRMVYEDRRLVIVDKPPFLPVTPGGHYLENCLLHLVREAMGEKELTPVHRIDKDTSGLVALSRRSESRRELCDLFRGDRGEAMIEKEYLALCEAPEESCPDRFELEDHIARDPEAYHRQVVLPGRIPNAFCRVERIRHEARKALFRLHPRTGRKHQLRVQLSHAGFPIVHDRIYGSAPRLAPHDLTEPLQLNCRRLRIPAIRGGEPIEGESRFLLEGEA